MRKNYRNKIRLILSIVICSLFIVGGFSTVTMESTKIEIHQTNHEQQTSKTDDQNINIEDIGVLAVSGSPTTLECDAGGPYYWDWSWQLHYHPPGVRFHGSVHNATLLTTLTWDFGDGTNKTDNFPGGLFPVHLFNQTGVYNITLTARDNSTTPPGYASDNTTVWLAPVPCPPINITVPRLSIITIKANITNPTGYDATYVNWKINISWGRRMRLERTIANGTIEKIKYGDSRIVQTEQYFFGFGLIHVMISVFPENIPGTTEHLNGLKIRKFIFLKEYTPK